MPDGKGTTGDTTGRKAVKLAALEFDESWVQLIEEVEASLRPQDMKLLDLQRSVSKARGRRWATRYVARKMYYSERRIREMWRELIYYTAFMAIKRGLVGPEK